MSTIIRRFSASVNIPNTSSAAFDPKMENFVTKAITTGDTTRVAGIVQGFNILPTPETDNSVDLVGYEGKSVLTFQSEDKESFMSFELVRTYSISLDAFEEGAMVMLAMVPDFVTRRASLVIFSGDEFLTLPAEAITLAVVTSHPETQLAGNDIAHAGTLTIEDPETEELVPFRFKREEYDPYNRKIAKYDEAFVTTTPVAWVTGSAEGSWETNDTQSTPSPRYLEIVGNEDNFELVFPHRLTPFVDTDLTNNKIRAKIVYGLSEGATGTISIGFRPASGDDYVYPTSFSVNDFEIGNEPSEMWVEFTPTEAFPSDRNYRLVITSTDFDGNLFILGVHFEANLSPSGTPYVAFNEGAIYVPTSSSGGGSGATIIPDEGSISGVYEGDVVCSGSATIDGETIILGDLICGASLINSGGYLVSVLGDVHLDFANFTPNLDEGVTQGAFAVGGSLYVGYFRMDVNRGENPVLYVRGNITAVQGGEGSGIYGEGKDGANGISIFCGGNFVADYVNIEGGNTFTADYPAGNGGTLEVYGMLSIRGYTAEGGNAESVTQNAGQGGDIDVYGNAAFGNCSVQGGDAYPDLETGISGNAGDGGYIDIRGYLSVLDEMSLRGGFCQSASPDHRAGKGGRLDVEGDLSGDGYLETDGGYREGNLSEGGGEESPDGGNIDIGGNVSMQEIRSNGGEVYTTGAAPHAAGNGGDLDVDGSYVCGDTYLNGGFSTQGKAGDGGQLDVLGTARCGDVEVNGGASEGGSGGNGGTIDIEGHATLDDADARGGDALTSNSLEGGQGGSIDIGGNLVSGSLSLYGGVSQSESIGARSGAGGSFNVEGSAVTGQIEIYSGDRQGTLTSAGNISAVDGGNISVRGDLVAGSIMGNGSTVNTDKPLSPGGRGTNINVQGSLTVNGTVSISGGNAVGFNGGNGGNFFVRGMTNLDALTGRGGVSSNSIDPGGDAALYGSGSSVEFYGGCKVSFLDISDDATAVAATYLQLQGHCFIGVLTTTDRADVYIRPLNDAPASLQLAVMNGKTTLDNNALVSGIDITSLLESSMFIWNMGSNWYALTGTSLAD